MRRGLLLVFVLEAHRQLPGDAEIESLRQRLIGLAAQHSDKRALLARLDSDDKIRALLVQKDQLADARRLTELSLQDVEKVINATSPRESYDARGGQSFSSGDPTAHERAQEKAGLLRRRIGDIDAQGHELDDAIDRRCAEIGL
jgi:hypothetical protein